MNEHLNQKLVSVIIRLSEKTQGTFTNFTDNDLIEPHKLLKYTHGDFFKLFNRG